MKKIYLITTAMVVLFSGILSSCKKEYPNNNAPEERQVLNSADGLIPLIVGIKARWSASGFSAVYGAITCNGLTTGELAVLNAGNADLANLALGGNTLVNNNGTVYNLWANCLNVMSEAQKLIDNASKVTDVPTANTIRVYGHLYKALAIGTLCQFWERVPVTTGTNVPFKSRAEALADAITLLDQAYTLVGSYAIPPTLLSRVGNEISLANTLAALSARYNNMLGRNNEAITKAGQASLTVRSTYIYDGTFQNPVFRSSLTTNNVYGVRTNFGLTGANLPDAGDGRIAFYLTPNAQRGSGHFLSDLTSIPIYQPGEMILIIAEANARLNTPASLTAAVAAINQVRTKTPAGDIYGVGSNTTSYSGATTQTAILDEIYRQRCIELYMSGMKLEDARRFGKAADRNRTFYPYPQQERDGNTNCPPDPAG